jgi:hypothetical protein
MDTCTVETGLLRKHPCGEKATTKCANCEQSLCAKHAVPRTSAGKRTFLCPECAKAWKQQEKTVGELPSTPASALPPQAEKKPADKPAPAAHAPAAKAPLAKPPAAKPPAPEKKPEPPQEDSGPLEFTPSKKPDDKK